VPTHPSRVATGLLHAALHCWCPATGTSDCTAGMLCLTGQPNTETGEPNLLILSASHIDNSHSYIRTLGCSLQYCGVIAPWVSGQLLQWTRCVGANVASRG